MLEHINFPSYIKILNYLALALLGMSAKTVRIAYAGGSFPGGMYQAGFNNVLSKNIEVAAVSGASSGSLNAYLMGTGQASKGKDVWMQVLSNLPKVYSLNPAQWIHNHSLFTIQKPVFEAIDTYVSLTEFQQAKIPINVVYSSATGFGISKRDSASLFEQVLQPMLTLSIVRKLFHSKKSVINNQGEISEKELKTAFKGSCCLSPFYGWPVKSSEGLLHDGVFVDEIGGADLLVEKLNENTELLVVTRYAQNSKKFAKRKIMLEELCQKHEIPTSTAMLIGPQTQLVSSNYTNNLKELVNCFDIGQSDAERILNKI
jgi:hypothetical protein